MTAGPAGNDRRISGPSSLYRAELWRLGLLAVRVLPRPFAGPLCYAAAGLYRSLHPRRREAVVQNLLPALNGDRGAAERKASALFREFAFKVADLWRIECGVPLEDWRIDLRGWDLFASAQARGRGVLMLTPHLGNWELGGPLLTSRGVRLLVLTQPEPGSGLTELRRASRARWGIETLVVRQDAFAFVEVIQRLQEGATVALLIDRPPSPTAVTVELFGRPFLASVAAAELARASGCTVLGTALLPEAGGYRVGILPEFTYDRRALGDREGRRQFTQQILRAFEPVIRQHLDQWYHFVPIWPETPAAR